MRTTLSLDEDVATSLANLVRESNQSFKMVVNDALRRGLGDSAPPEPKFIVRAHDGGLQPGIDHRRLNELAWEDAGNR